MRTSLTLALAFLALSAACGGGEKTPACPHASCPNPHPAGWAVRGSPSFHGTEARSVSTCVDCHDQGDATVICVACHAAGGAGGNIHLPDFLLTHTLGDVTGGGSASIGGGIVLGCLACHVP